MRIVNEPIDRTLRSACLAVLACLPLVACDGCRAKSSWPELPQSHEAALRAFDGASTRPATKDEAPFQREATFAFAMSSLPSGVVTKTAVAGWPAIDERLASWVNETREKSALIAFGVSYDAPAQLEAFRRLIGARAKITWTRVVIEHLHADGKWNGVDAETQVGDDVVLDRFASGGARATLAPLITRVERDRLVPWKFGSAELLADVLAESRAAGRSLSGCDVSEALRTRLSSLDDDALQRTRELHCALALREHARPDDGISRVAALWERTHVHTNRFPRLAPVDWTSLRILVMDAPSDERMVLVDPILTYAGALLLPSPTAETRFQKRLSRVEAPKSRLQSTAKKVLREPTAMVDGVPFDGTKPIAEGQHFLTVDKSGVIFAAIVDVPANGALDVLVADDAPEVVATLLAPKPL